MSSVMTSSALSAFDLRDEIDKKLSQAKGICGVIRVGRDMAMVEKEIRASLWVVDELIEDAEKAVNELHLQASAEKEVQS